MGTFEQRSAETPSRKPRSIGHSASQKLLFPQPSPLPLCSLLPASYPCSTSRRKQTIRQEAPKSEPSDPKDHLPCTQPPHLPSCSSRGGAQGLSKASPFGFQPSPLAPHPSVSPSLSHITGPILSTASFPSAFETCSSLSH